MFYQILFSPQVKQYAFITCKYGIYELPHELPNNLKLLGKLENIREAWKIIRIITQRPVPRQNENLANTGKTITKPPPQCAIPHENPSQPQISREWLSPETIPRPQLTPDSLKLNFHDNFDNSKAFHTAST